MTQNKIDKAWMLFLNSSNYYVLTTIGLYYDLLQVKTKYPIYCAITENVSNANKEILKKIGLNLIEINTNKSKLSILKTNTDKNNEAWKNAFAKLLIIGSDFEKQFNKICYIDTDVRIFKNMDELFDYPHMAAVEDCAPIRKSLQQPYTLGCSIFCSGLFIWDFENHPNEGEQLLDNLKTLNTNIIWHDQNVLNYFYQDWKNKEELHIPPKYCVMTAAHNFELVGFNNICAVHYTNRNKTDWPFNSKIIFKTTSINKIYSFKSWVANIANAVYYFNTKYNLHIQAPCAVNIDEMTPDEYVKWMRTQRADGRVGCYLYF